MQATIDSFALKPFTRALQCLSKYGDDLLIYATAHSMALSVTNPSMSAYCRFTYDRQFFVRYHLGPPKSAKGKERAHGEGQDEESPTVTGQLLVKSLLSILKHRTVEKSVERCEFVISDGPPPQPDDSVDEDEQEEDTLESTLVLRLHCQHGVVKTHRLLLHNPNALTAPNPPNSEEASRLTVSARTIRDIIDQLPSARAGAGGFTGKNNAKSDPQLAWLFNDNEVTVKSLEMGADARGKAQLASEISISADEFDLYDVVVSPLTIAFHLREFMAAIAYTEALALALAMKFTTGSAPLFIDVDGGDGYEVLFVISTSSGGAALANQTATRTRTNGLPNQANTDGVNTRKRMREDSEADLNSDAGAMPPPPVAREGSVRITPARIHPQRAVQRADPATHARIMAATSRSSVPPPPTFPPLGSQAWPATPARPLSQASSMGPPSNLLPPPSQAQSLAPPVQVLSPFTPSTHVSDSDDLGYVGPFGTAPARQPLFLPSSQPDDERFDVAPPMSQSEIAGAQEIAGMTDAELWAVFEDNGNDDEELVPSSQHNERELLSVRSAVLDDEGSLPGTSDDEFDELNYDGMSEVDIVAPTQGRPRPGSSREKAFHPLFED